MKIKKEKKRRVPAIKIPKNPEVRYRNSLIGLINEIVKAVNSRVIPKLKISEPEYVSDTYADDFEKIFEDLRRRFEITDNSAKILANPAIANLDLQNRIRFYRAIKNAMGVDLSSVIRNEGLADILKSATRVNVALIKTIPQEYFKKLETIIYTETMQGSTSESMIDQIKKLNDNNYNRAKLIARDQISKINSALTQQRAQNLGSEEYVWLTSKDDRVRPTHRVKNGKIFKWSEPPKDTGHPGNDIQCRCVAQPILKI